MAIAYWDPFREVVSLQGRLNSIFQGLESLPAGPAPAVDVYEDDATLVFNMEVPGIKPEDLDIRIEKNVLTVRGERKVEKSPKNYHRMERSYGSFYRSFSLPGSFDTENVQATYDAGVLRLELAKKPEAKPRQIKVDISGTTPKLSAPETPETWKKEMERELAYA